MLSKYCNILVVKYYLNIIFFFFIWQGGATFELA